MVAVAIRMEMALLGRGGEEIVHPLVVQAVYQVGGEWWEQCYPRLRDSLVATQHRDPKNPREDGWWTDTAHVQGKPGQLYGTAVGCFVLAIPNRYLPILQDGKIEGLKRLPTKE